MDTINVFGGRGFIGSHFAATYPAECVVNEYSDYQVRTNNVLYFISTIDNYNVFTDPHLDINTNLNTLIAVLQSIRNPYDTTFNFISSWFVYGDTDLPARETSYCDPKGFYSITKRAAEQLLISYCETFGIKYRILRLANVIGSDDRKTSRKKNALVYMVDQLKRHEDVYLYDGGELYRDIIHVDDCVRAIRLVMTAGEVNAIYNIGNGVPVQIAEFIQTAKEMIGSTSRVLSKPTPEFHKIVQVKSMYMNTDKLYSLGYRPQYSTTDIIQSLI